MSVRRLDPNQPQAFAFTNENLAWARQQITKYPEGKQAAAVLPLLWRAQEQHDQWLPEPAIRNVAEMLDMPYIRVYEIATFYTMFNLSPVGRYHVQVCGTTPCMLRGANDIKAVCERLIGKKGRVTPDGTFSWEEVECLGACVNAPMVQIGKDFYEDLTPETFEALLNGLKEGRAMKTGPQTDRHLSAPKGGQTTLLDPEIFKPRPPTAKQPTPRSDDEKKTQNTAQAAAETVASIATPTAKGGERAAVDTEMARFRCPDGAPDDLTKIAGIDTSLQSQLNQMGLYRYGQVGKLTAEDREWLETRLPRFKGATAEWTSQAKALIDANAPGGAAPDVVGTRQGKTADEN